jgi:hypothetical protein
MQDREDVRLLARIDQAGRHLVHLGLSSAMVRQTMQNTWG